METQKHHFKHYYDTGDHATNRGFDMYQSMVFVDEGKDWLRAKPDRMVPENAMEWSTRHLHRLDHVVPVPVGDTVQARKDRAIEFDWDWKEEKIFGGLDTFFAENAQILDLGSGKGIAVKEINERFKDIGVHCIGVDARYAEESELAENLVVGDFGDLPFADASFDRILSVESFPCWLPSEEKIVDRYISEITRVSKVGTIWRGTLFEYDDFKKPVFSVEVIINKFVVHGWEVVVRGNQFVAMCVLSASDIE